MIAPVPWLDLRPARAPANPPLARPCRPRDLHARLFLQGETGSLVGGVSVVNASHRACALVGRPQIALRGAPAARLRIRPMAWPAPRCCSPDVLADPPGSLRALQPGKQADAYVFWSNWCRPPPARLEVRLPTGGSIDLPLRRAPRCDQPRQPSLLRVSRFEPAVRQLPRSSRLPLRAVILRPPQPRRGRVLRYRVALLNTGATPFRFAATSCPVYIEQLASSPPQAYVLNCRGVAAVPPHGRAVFAMELRVAQDARVGPSDLSWELAPRTFDAPLADAAVRVEP
jgi:hypothetical protein